MVEQKNLKSEIIETLDLDPIGKTVTELANKHNVSEQEVENVLDEIKDDKIMKVGKNWRWVG